MVFSPDIFSSISTLGFCPPSYLDVFLHISQLTGRKGGEVEARDKSPKVNGGRRGGAEDVAPETLVRRLDARDRQASRQLTQ